MKIRLIIISIILSLITPNLKAQTQEYSLTDCINRALQYNLQVRQAGLTAKIKQVNKEQAMAARFPTLDANVRQDISWSDQVESEGGYNFTRYSGSSLSINSNLILFNGFHNKNTIKQSALEYQGSVLSLEELRQSISLQVLDNYLQVLYAGEQVTNSKNQLISTGSQLELAKERLDLRIISQAEYLQIKAQEASERLTLANAEKQLRLTRLNLMQLLELPVNDSFVIISPDYSSAGKQTLVADASTIFENALNFRPEVKNAALQKRIAGYDLEIAKSGYLPSLSLNAGIGTSFSSMVENLKFASQLDHNLTPIIGITLSVPIFRQKQVESQVSIARIHVESASISEQTALNQLRKSIESAWVDVISAEKEFDAGSEQYYATSVSFGLATERFNLGVINSVDFLYEKTNLINAECQFLQARYNLIFSYKVLEFYLGKPLEL